MPKVAIKNPIVSKLTGVISHDQIFHHWWRSKKVNIPFFENTKLEVIYVNEEPNQINEFIKRADQKLTKLITTDSINQLLITTILNKEYANYLSNQNETHTTNIISKADDIWHNIMPTYIYLERDIMLSNKIIITVICECLCDKDFKLQLHIECARKHLKISAEYEHVIQPITHHDKEVINSLIIEPIFENVLCR